MIASLLSADWTLDAPQSSNTVSWKNVQELFVQQQPLIRLTNDCRTLITWKVTSEHLKLGSKKLPRGKKVKEMEKYFAKIEKKLSIRVSNLSPGQTSGLPKTSEYFEQLTKLPLSPPSQLVDIIFSENDFQKTLLTLEFAGFPPLDDLTIKAMHQFIFYPKFGTIQLDLIAKPDVSKKCIWVPPHNVGVLSYAKFNKVSGHLMIDCAHFRVQELNHNLSDSLENYPKAMILESEEQQQPSNESKKTPLEALFLSTNTVAVQIEATNSPPRRASLSSRFQVSPVSNAPKPSWRKASDPSAIKPLHVDALSLNVATKNSMVISPSDSIDSGVISPGIVSDDSLRLSSNNTDSSFSPRHPKLRERSASECFPNQTPIVPGLKGILKKPKSSFTSSASSGLRRSPASSRMLFSRSISECHDNSVSSESSGMELDFLGESNDTLASSSPPRSVGGFFNRVEEENEYEEDEDSDSQIIAAAEIQSRKKRVSFSEHVQARIYRTGSSIIGQKKKNERRNRCRRIRSSGSTDSDGTLNGTDDENSSFSISPSDRLNLEMLAKEYASNNPSATDSTPVHSARNLSTDSAYDDEIDSETEKRMEMLSVA
jgi:hypothetical protein